MKKGEKMTEEQKKILKEKIAKGKAEAKARRNTISPSRKIEIEDEVASPIVLDTNIETAKAATPAVKVESSDIIWFTEVDYNDKGKIANDYPAYYDEISIKELKEDIRVLTEQLDDDVYQGKKKRIEKARLDKMQDRYDKIQAGRPKLEGAKKDKVANSMKNLGERIKESMFSYDAHWKQTADAHTVAERMVTPCIEVKDEFVNSFVKQRGFKMENGKISQNDASIIFKTMCKLIGEQSDTDKLRPIRSHGNTL